MTNILDSASLPWDNGCVRQLRTVLSKAYRRSSEIEEIVERVAPFLAGSIGLENGSGAELIWKQAMDVVARAGLLRKLLGAVLADERVGGFHEEIRTIMDELGGDDHPRPSEKGDHPRPSEKTALAPADSVSMTGLAATLVADLPRLADQLIEEVQRLASGSGPLDTALAAAAATTAIRSIKEALNSIDDIGPGQAAETPADDRDNALRKEIREQLDVASPLLPKIAARPDDTTSVTGFAVAAGRLRASVRSLADLRERQHRAR
jgi:hypothetical protein